MTVPRPRGSAAGADWASTAAEALPDDPDSVLVGRIWDPSGDGPSPVTVRDGEVIDLSHRFPTVRDICELPDPAATVAGLDGPRVGDFGEILANTGAANRDSGRPGCSPRSTSRRSRPPA